MSKLDVVIKLWENEVEEQEMDLIINGVPPDIAHEQAVSMIISKRRKINADKSGG